MSDMKCVFCDLRVVARKFASPFATQRRSLRKFHLRYLRVRLASALWNKCGYYARNSSQIYYTVEDV